MSAVNIDVDAWPDVLSRIEWLQSGVEALCSAAHSECDQLHSNNGDPFLVARSADRVMIFTAMAGEYLQELGLQSKILCERLSKAHPPRPGKVR